MPFSRASLKPQPFSIWHLGGVWLTQNGHFCSLGEPKEPPIGSKHSPQFGENGLLSCLEQTQVLDSVENPGLGGENRFDFRQNCSLKSQRTSPSCQAEVILRIAA
jgi:hypothetical protein